MARDWRYDLYVVQMFVTEGVVYDLLAAALGVILGLAISYAIVIGPALQQRSGTTHRPSEDLSSKFASAPPHLDCDRPIVLGVLFTFVRWSRPRPGARQPMS